MLHRKKIEKKNGKGVKYRGKVRRRGVVTVSWTGKLIYGKVVNSDGE